jgi:hypothetical protein
MKQICKLLLLNDFVPTKRQFDAWKTVNKKALQAVETTPHFNDWKGY